MSKQRVPLFRQPNVSRCRNIGTLLSEQRPVETMGRSLHIIYFFKISVTLNDLHWNRYNKIPIYYHVITSSEVCIRSLLFSLSPNLSLSQSLSLPISLSPNLSLSQSLSLSPNLSLMHACKISTHSSTGVD